MNITAVYCGGCNPQIDREAIVKQLGRRLGKPIYPFRSGIEPDLILFINGCPRQCANPRTSGGWGGKAVVVAGFSIDAWEVPTEELADILFSKIREMRDTGSRDPETKL